jgi:hypothetical protein
VPDPRLLWRRANESTLQTLRGESRGQYDIRLGRRPEVEDFFSGLPRVLDHEGSRIEITTEPAPIEGGGAELPPYDIAVRQMSERSERSGELYVRAQRPASAHPLWRPGVGPTEDTAPDTDYVLLARTADDRFYAGWLRGPETASLPGELRRAMESREVGVATVSDAELAALIPGAEPSPPAGGTAWSALEDEIADVVAEAPEGRRQTVLHVRRERSAPLRAAKVAAAGRPVCEACGFDFARVYGERGEDFIECHHTIPLAELDPGRPTKLADLALLCANCHRMIHRGRQWLTVEELRSLLRSVAGGGHSPDAHAHS